MTKPLVSTITPCFRMKAYLKKFLDELPKQTIFDKIQIVLDHNEPTEEELEWVREFQEKYPNVIKHIIVNPVEPIGTSMNRCIKEADGELITIWNVDDLRTPDSLEKQARMFELYPECDISNGNFVIVNSFGSVHGKLVDHTMYELKEYYRSMILGPFFMFRKNLVEKAGYFDEQFKSGADFDLAIRLAANAREIMFPPGILGYYLDEGKGASTRGDGRQPTERTVIELRYGILDKVDSTWIQKTESYNLKEITQFGKKDLIENYVPNFEEFYRNNNRG